MDVSVADLAAAYVTTPPNTPPSPTDPLPADPLPAYPLIDVRSLWEYNQGHVPGALNLSLPRILMAQTPLLRRWVLPTWFMDLDPMQPVAVICLTAHRSPIAAQALNKLGFRQVLNVQGGMMAWRKASLPVHRS
jgi:rhodanese-related sulfurtransferase